MTDTGRLPEVDLSALIVDLGRKIAESQDLISALNHPPMSKAEVVVRAYIKTRSSSRAAKLLLEMGITTDQGNRYTAEKVLETVTCKTGVPAVLQRFAQSIRTKNSTASARFAD